MIPTKLSASFLLLSMLAAFAFGAQDCPLLSTQQVQEIFQSDSVKLSMADTSGSCNWYMNDQSDVLQISQIKQPSAALAGELFKHYETVTYADFTDNATRPDIGDKAFIGIKKDYQTFIDLVILQNDALYSFKYTVQADRPILSGTLDALLHAGRTALSSADKTSQSFGGCAWLPPKELDRLLGKTGQTVQSLSDKQCMAYATPGDGSLMAMGSSMNERAFNIMMSELACTVKPLPEFGETTYAYYDCPAPATGAMSVELLKDGRHMSVTYKPNARRATLADLDAMNALVKHIHSML